MKENKQARQWLEYPELRERFRILHHVSGLEIWLDYKEIRPTACYLLARFGSWHRRLKIGNKMVELPAGTILTFLEDSILRKVVLTQGKINYERLWDNTVQYSLLPKILLFSVVATICGTDADPQGKAASRKKLEDAGAIVLPSNAQATRFTQLMLKNLRG